MLVVIQLPHWTPFVRVTADILVNDYYGLTSYLVDAVSIQMTHLSKRKSKVCSRQVRKKRKGHIDGGNMPRLRVDLQNSDYQKYQRRHRPLFGSVASLQGTWESNSGKI